MRLLLHIKITRLMILTLFFFILSNELFAKPVEHYLEISFVNNPVLKSFQHTTEESEALFRRESIFARNPLLSFSYSNVPVSEWPALDAHPMSGMSIGISQYIATPWEDHYRKMTMYQMYLSRKEKYNEAKNLLAFQVQSAYHNLLYIYTREDILAENKKILQSVLRIAESLVAVNKMSGTHLLKLRAGLDDIENKILRIQGAEAKARGAMEKLAGVSLDWSDIRNDITHWIPEEAGEAVAESFTPETHPVYRSIEALYRSREAELKHEKAALTPGVTIGADYRIRKEIPGRDEGEDFISLMASIPVPLFYPIKERHGIAAKEQSFLAMKEMLRSVKVDLQSRWKGERANNSKLREAFVNYRRAVLPGYYAAYRGQVGALASGTIGLIDVLDTYRMYLNASMAHAKLYRDLTISSLWLRYLLHEYPGSSAADIDRETHHEQK